MEMPKLTFLPSGIKGRVKAKWKGVSHQRIPSLVWVKIHTQTHTLGSIRSPRATGIT